MCRHKKNECCELCIIKLNLSASRQIVVEVSRETRYFEIDTINPYYFYSHSSTLLYSCLSSDYLLTGVDIFITKQDKSLWRPQTILGGPAEPCKLHSLFVSLCFYMGCQKLSTYSFYYSITAERSAAGHHCNDKVTWMTGLCFLFI